MADVDWFYTREDGTRVWDLDRWEAALDEEEQAIDEAFIRLDDERRDWRTRFWIVVGIFAAWVVLYDVLGVHL